MLFLNKKRKITSKDSTDTNENKENMEKDERKKER